MSHSLHLKLHCYQKWNHTTKITVFREKYLRAVYVISTDNISVSEMQINCNSMGGWDQEQHELLRKWGAILVMMHNYQDGVLSLSHIHTFTSKSAQGLTFKIHKLPFHTQGTHIIKWININAKSYCENLIAFKKLDCWYFLKCVF